jgi:ferredoxin-NADP reductase
MRFQIPLLKKESVANNTLLLRFQKPEGFGFKPGQFVQVSLPDSFDSDDRGNSRDISIASAPFEKELIFVVRLRDSSFKKGLEKLSIGKEITIKNAQGPFLLHEDTHVPAVFIAGGIGVTPFRSMLLHNLYNKLPFKTVLFYSSKNENDGIFLKELQRIEKENHNHKNIISFTSLEKNDIGLSERGRINREMVTKYISDLGSPLFYLAGPLGMVKSMESMLDTMGIQRERIVLDYFTGYEQSV